MVIKMLFNCCFCEKDGMELSLGTYLAPSVFHGGEPKETDIIVMKCIECGVQEPCEDDDLIGFIMHILGETNYQKAMIKALQIIWKETHMKEMIE